MYEKENWLFQCRFNAFFSLINYIQCSACSLCSFISCLLSKLNKAATIRAAYRFGLVLLSFTSLYITHTLYSVHCTVYTYRYTPSMQRKSFFFFYWIVYVSRFCLRTACLDRFPNHWPQLHVLNIECVFVCVQCAFHRFNWQRQILVLIFIYEYVYSLSIQFEQKKKCNQRPSKHYRCPKWKCCLI